MNTAIIPLVAEVAPCPWVTWLTWKQYHNIIIYLRHWQTDGRTDGRLAHSAEHRVVKNVAANKPVLDMYRTEQQMDYVTYERFVDDFNIFIILKLLANRPPPTVAMKELIIQLIRTAERLERFRVNCGKFPSR